MGPWELSFEAREQAEPDLVWMRFPGHVQGHTVAALVWFGAQQAVDPQREHDGCLDVMRPLHCLAQAGPVSMGDLSACQPSGWPCQLTAAASDHWTKTALKHTWAPGGCDKGCVCVFCVLDRQLATARSYLPSASVEKRTEQKYTLTCPIILCT